MESTTFPPVPQGSPIPTLVGYALRLPNHSSSTETLLSRVLAKAFPDLNSLFVPPNEQLHVYCYQLWNRVRIAAKEGHRLQKCRILNDISQALNALFFYLHHTDPVSITSAHQLANQLLRSLKETSRDMDGLEEIREVVQCIDACLNSHSLLTQPCGPNTTLLAHRPFLKAMLEMVSDQLTEQRWRYPPYPLSSLFMPIKVRNDEMKQKALEQTQIFLAALDDPKCNSKQISCFLNEPNVFLTSHDLNWNELQDSKATLHSKREMISYYQSIFNYYYYFPSRSFVYFSTIFQGSFALTNNFSISQHNELMFIFDQLCEETTVLVSKMLENPRRAAAARYIERLLLCWTVMKAVQKNNADNRDELQRSPSKKVIFSISQNLVHGFNEAASCVEELQEVMRVLRLSVDLDDQICAAMTHSYSLLDYSVRGAMVSLRGLISTDVSAEHALLSKKETATPRMTEQEPVRPVVKRRRKRHHKRVVPQAEAPQAVQPPPQPASSIPLAEPKSVPQERPISAQPQLRDAFIRIHSRRLGTTRAAFSELESSEEESTLPSGRKRRMFQKISLCQSLLESALIRCMAEQEELCAELVANAIQHSLVGLANLLQSDPSVQSIVDEHHSIIRTLSEAHSAVFYLERSGRGTTSKEIISLLYRINDAKTAADFQQCERLVNLIVNDAFSLANKLQKREMEEMAHVQVAVDLDEPGMPDEATSLIEISLDNRLPQIHSRAEAQERIRWCRQLIRVARKLPAASGPFQNERKEERNCTLSHVERYLSWLHSSLLSEEQAFAERPLTLTLSLMDTLHRALKEMIIASLQHEPAYEKGVHLVDQCANPTKQRPLLFENNLCASFQVLCNYHAAADRVSLLRGLPAGFTQRLGWLRGIHDRLAYPGRSKGQPTSVYALIARIQKLEQQKRTLQKVEAGWSYQAKKRTLDLKDIETKIKSKCTQLMREALYPGLDALYLILRAAFQEHSAAKDLSSEKEL